LSFVHLPADESLQVADLGCGSGGQTLTLAQNLNARVTAVDLFPVFLGELNQKTKQLGLANKISTVEASIDELPFSKEQFDLIWSEGAIYNIGFKNGIVLWKEFLKPGGYLAVSEMTWISQSRPKEIEEFWTREYPEIDTAANKIRILEENGFTLEGYFNLGPDSWIESYYRPMESRFEAFLSRHNHSELAHKVVDDHKSEIELYHTYHDHFSYGFYVARIGSHP
jgi:ubiquinone/menaquinone biosynthesis C-methylase UbiE